MESSKKTTPQAEMTPPSLEERRVKLEEAKLEIELARFRQDQRFFTKHMSGAITGAVALAGVAVSGTNVLISYLEQERTLKQQSEDLNYKWRSDMMQFLVQHADDVFSEKTERTQRMQKIMMAAYPADIVSDVFLNLQAASESDAAKKDWETARSAVKRVSTTGYVFIGRWQHGAWVSSSFEPADKAGQLPSPEHLSHLRLRVPAAIADVYVRSLYPDENGANRPVKGVLHAGEQVIVQEAPLYNDGQHDSGYIWARVLPAD